MSKARETFALSIQDAENLLQHFDKLNTKLPPAEIEVQKRAGLVMAMTAWETYVEDRLVEACRERMRGVRDGLRAAISSNPPASSAPARTARQNSFA